MILKLSSFKTTKIHYLTVAVDHEFGHGLWLKSFELTVTLGGWGEDTWKGLIRGGSVSQVTSVVLGRIQFFMGVGWRTSLPCHEAFSLWLLTQQLTSSEQANEKSQGE